MEKEVKGFLDSVLSVNTRKTYVRGLEIFEEYTGKTMSPKELLEQYLQLKAKQKESITTEDSKTPVDALEDELMRRKNLGFCFLRERVSWRLL